MAAKRSDGRARPPRRRVAGLGRHAGEVRRRRAWRSSLLTATRGDAGRYRGHPPGRREHPGAVGAGRASAKAELRAAAAVLGVARGRRCSTIATSSSIAPSRDEVVAVIARHLRRVRPDVVVTFGPDGALRASRSHRDLPVHDGGDRRRGRPGVRRRRAPARRTSRTPCRSCTTSRGRHRRGRPIRRRSRRLTVDGRRRRTAGDAVAGMGDHDA